MATFTAYPRAQISWGPGAAFAFAGSAAAVAFASPPAMAMNFDQRSIDLSSPPDERTLEINGETITFNGETIQW